VPLVFSHLDGTVNSIDKAVLYKNLEKRVDSVGPELIDVYIVDGFFFVHLLGPNLPQTYEDIAKFILVKLCKDDSPCLRSHHIPFHQRFGT
jgi:hypothetical protein